MHPLSRTNVPYATPAVIIGYGLPTRLLPYGCCCFLHEANQTDMLFRGCQSGLGYRSMWRLTIEVGEKQTRN